MTDPNQSLQSTQPIYYYYTPQSSFYQTPPNQSSQYFTFPSPINSSAPVYYAPAIAPEKPVEQIYSPIYPPVYNPIPTNPENSIQNVETKREVIIKPRSRSPKREIVRERSRSRSPKKKQIVLEGSKHEIDYRKYMCPEIVRVIIGDRNRNIVGLNYNGNYVIGSSQILHYVMVSKKTPYSSIYIVADYNEYGFKNAQRLIKYKYGSTINIESKFVVQKFTNKDFVGFAIHTGGRNVKHYDVIHGLIRILDDMAMCRELLNLKLNISMFKFGREELIDMMVIINNLMMYHNQKNSTHLEICLIV